jgi:hypothetical protein
MHFSHTTTKTLPGGWEIRARLRRGNDKLSLLPMIVFPFHIPENVDALGRLFNHMIILWAVDLTLRSSPFSGVRADRHRSTLTLRQTHHARLTVATRQVKSRGLTRTPGLTILLCETVHRILLHTREAGIQAWEKYQAFAATG